MFHNRTTDCLLVVTQSSRFVLSAAQRNFSSFIRSTFDKSPHLQSAEQRGGHQPRAGERLHQRGLGAGHAGNFTQSPDILVMFETNTGNGRKRCSLMDLNDVLESENKDEQMTLFTSLKVSARELYVCSHSEPPQWDHSLPVSRTRILSVSRVSPSFPADV